MRIGVPRSFFYYTYKPFVETFSKGLGLSVEVGKETDEQVLEKGVASCVDEACFPVKVFHGHVQSLSEKCDAVVVPRVMRTEYGESICPKVAGLPDMVSGTGKSKKLIFTSPLYLDDRQALKRSLWKSCKALGITKSRFNDSFSKGIEAQRKEKAGIEDTGYKHKVFLAGHAYNIYDPFANLNVIEKLHNMDVGVVTEERVQRKDKLSYLNYADLMKQPYWSFFVNLFGSIGALREQGIDGVVYLSSFSCGTDSFTIEMLKNNLDGIPLLVLKLDEQRGEAGFDTRLEAFLDVLKGRGNRKQ